MLDIENVVKSYKYHTVLEGFSLKVEKGQIYGLAGAQGSGKTTVMRIAAGLERPDSGCVSVDGMDMSRNPRTAKRKIGYVPEVFGSYEELTVYEYMSFFSAIHGIPKADSEGIINQLLELVNLLDKRERYVSTLTPDMKKWLCLARSLVHSPDLLILDEPSAGFDRNEWAEMKEILKTLREIGKTVLISSNNLPDIADLCTVIGIMEHGRIGISGSHGEVMKNAKKVSII